MSKADDLVAYEASRIGIEKYGERSINELPQRGPDSADCIGFQRQAIFECDLEGALWPTAWGGPDSWTVGNFHDAWKAHDMPEYAGDTVPNKGDLLVYGADEHIGCYDGAGGMISALNVETGVCRSGYRDLTLPVTAILATGLAQAEPVHVPPPPVTDYTIEPGDTLDRIAARFGVSPSALAALNGIKNPDLIYAGSDLQIPEPSGEPAEPPAPPEPATYTVQPGDTLSAIAERLLGSTDRWEEIFTANRHVIGSNPDLIQPGQVLTIEAR